MGAPAQLFGELVSIVAPVYLCVALGWGWARLGRRYDTELVTDLVMNVGAPCLVFTSLVAIEAPLGEMLEMVGATLLALASFAGIGAALLRGLGLPLRTFLGPVVFGNTGNMGLPVCLFAFGEPGLVLAVCFYATTAFVHFTLGQGIWSGSFALGTLLRTPLTWATLLAAGVVVGGLPVPLWLGRTTELLGDFAIPLMQFTLGVTLARLSVAGLGRSVGISLLRIGTGLVVGVGLAWGLGLEGVGRGVFILDCTMPIAVFNYLLAERYARSPDEVASAVVVSTLISLLTLPVILVLLIQP